MLSKLADYYQWRQRYSSTQANQEATFLHSHPEEKLPFIEGTLDFDNEKEMINLEIDSSLCWMGKGFNSTDDKVMQPPMVSL